MKSLLSLTLFLLLSLVFASEVGSEGTMEEHKRDFLSFDTNQDGKVDPSEVRRVFPRISQEELSAFFIASDKNEDGLIDFDEYIHASLEHADGSLNLDEYQIYKIHI